MTTPQRNNPMRRFVAAAATVIALAVVLPGAALAASGGDNNKGDFWVDTVSEPAGPGHEMDPHLPCANINLWGDKMADAGGSYTIDGWSPSGEKELAYSSQWAYNGGSGGVQVMDVINVQTLIANAVANGDAPINKQGFHFKIALSQDPHKFKTFWVKCPIPAPPSVTPQGGEPGSPSVTPNPPAAGNPAAPQQQVLGVRVNSGKKATKKVHRKHHKRVRHHRKHHKVVSHKLLPAFTG
jgi:hypothetical protein